MFLDPSFSELFSAFVLTFISCGVAHFSIFISRLNDLLSALCINCFEHLATIVVDFLFFVFIHTKISC